MAIDTKSPRTRRALLFGAVGALAASAAGALGRAAPTLAANGFPVIIGEHNLAISATKVDAQDSAFVGLWGQSASNAGVLGTSTLSNGVSGVGGTPSSAAGVYGTSTSGIGVKGASVSGVGVSGQSADNAGVFGTSTSSNGVSGSTVAQLGSGVYGSHTSGTGVTGYATNGTGVFAHGGGWGVQARTDRGIGVKTTAGADGYALETVGRVKFSTSGVAVIPPGLKSVTLSPGVSVSDTSAVLLTPEVDLGKARRLWFTKDTGGNKITIRMSSARTSATKISWLLLG